MFNVFYLCQLAIFVLCLWSFVEFFLFPDFNSTFIFCHAPCCCVFPLRGASDLFPGSCWLLLDLQLITTIGRLFKQPTPAIRVGSFIPVVGNWEVSDFVILLFCFKLTVVFSLFPELPVKEHFCVWCPARFTTACWSSLCTIVNTVNKSYTFEFRFLSTFSGSVLAFLVIVTEQSNLNRPHKQQVPWVYSGLPGCSY